MMQIGELAERAHLSLRTLRHYDEIGLLQPSARTSGGFRIYSDHDYDRLVLIRQARALGFSLDQVAELLTILDRDDPAIGSAGEKLEALLQEARIRRESMAENLDRADDLIAGITRRVHHVS